MRLQADKIVKQAISAVLPDAAVKRALETAKFPGRILLVAAGKAAWQMAHAAHEALGSRIHQGIVITKYDHSRGPIGNLVIREAGHPIPDENSFAATKEALALTGQLSETDTVLFLLSGGGSALFEVPLIPGEELQDITAQLLACGAEITEINTIRKRLSAVKGGKFAACCAPAQVFTIVLSDIIGDPLDMIASGPAYPDSSTCAQALEIAEKYGLRLSEAARSCLHRETPKELGNVTTQVTGSVRELCRAAAPGIAGMKKVCVFSVGSDGTDGPTDAAGGYVDGSTAAKLRQLGVEIPEVLQNNDAYHALQKVGGLIITGPTGTNVNDVAVVLLDGAEDSAALPGT